MKWLAAALLVVLVLLQCRLWLSGNGERALPPLEAAVAAQRAENAQLAERNRRLAAEVHDLKSGTAALEEEARSDLGMIRPGETFFQVAPRPGAAASATASATTPSVGAKAGAAVGAKASAAAGAKADAAAGAKAGAATRARAGSAAGAARAAVPQAAR